MITDRTNYHYEVEMAGAYAGGVLGGLFFGAVGDLLRSEVHTMLWYISGTVIGAIVGTIAATIFRRLPDNEPAADNGAH